MQSNGEVRALGRQSALIYPILLRFAPQDRPLSSPASQEKTLSILIMTGLDPVIFVHTQEDGRVKHGHDEKSSQNLPVGIQLNAAPGGEARLLASAKLLESMLGLAALVPIDPRQMSG